MKLVLIFTCLAVAVRGQLDGFDEPDAPYVAPEAFAADGGVGAFPVAPPLQPVLAIPLCKEPTVNETRVCGCVDPTTGHHEHNESWVSALRWKMRCNNGTIEITACVGSRAGNYVEVPVNKTVTVGGFWHKCEDTSSEVKYSQEPSCIVNGQEIHVNATFRQNNFKLGCEVWGFSVRGCYYDDLSGTEVALDVGQTKDEDIYRHYCEKIPSSFCTGCQDKVRYRVQAIKCKQGTKTYDEGQSWVGKNLKYLCMANGGVRIINCVTTNGTEIGIDQAIVVDNVLHKCYRIGNTVYYQANSCGFGQACQGGALAVPPYIHYPPTAQGEWPLIYSSSLSGDRESYFQKPLYPGN